MLNVLEYLGIVLLLSAIPGNEAGLICFLPSYKKYSKISSVNTNRSCLSANSAIHSSSVLLNTFPEGFAGVLIIIPFVRGVTTLSRSSGKNVQSGALKPTYVGTASAERMVFIWYP